MSLHAGVAIHNNDRTGLERLCRYGLRPPLAQGRLTRVDDGTIRYQMKRRFTDGRQEKDAKEKDARLNLLRFALQRETLIIHRLPKKLTS